MKPQITKEQIEADRQIRAWQKVAEAAKKLNNEKELQNARLQIMKWQDRFFEADGIKINWNY